MAKIQSHPVGKPSRHPLLILMVIVALFVLPIFVASLLYKYEWLPHHTTNKGELLSPPSQLTTVWSNKYPYQGKWQLLYVSADSCNSVCLKQIYNLRQVHRALGKEQDRVHRLLIAEALSKEFSEKLAEKYQGQLGIDLLSPKQLSQLRLKPGESYIVDPLGNVVLRYTTHPNNRDILKDIRHLLQVSNIG